MRRLVALSGLFSIAAAAACSEPFKSGTGTSGGSGGGGGGNVEPADAAGEYLISATNGANGCMFDGWMEGNMSTGIPFTVTQDGDEIQGTIGGAVGVVATLLLGSNNFVGTVVGDDFTMTNYGTKSSTSGSCAVTVNAFVDGSIDGDAIQGSIEYIPQTNGSPDCGVLNDCKTIASFSGVRPPK
jgi:hypothetical protein